MTEKSGQIRIGIGRWTLAPWRGLFGPKSLRQAAELADASARLTKPHPRDVFSDAIHEGKIRAPAGAMALIARLKC